MAKRAGAAYLWGMEHCDLLIAGGGIAGLTAAAAFAGAGFDVICVDPAPPVTQAEAQGADLRTTAFLQPARNVLEQAGLWDRLAPHAMPLEVMRIVDAGGADPTPRVVRDFRAAELSEHPFGWNLPNWLLRREMVAHLDTLPNVSFRTGIAAQSFAARESEARVTLSDGARVRARLVLAADGRNSAMRQAAGIGVSTLRYGQKALAFAVTHPKPHGNVSTEIHRSGGPFTQVPLPDRDGRPCSAIVWLERGPEVLRLQALDTPAFEAEMTARSAGLFGPLKLETRRTVWPIISQEAARLSARRLALMAEAAHVVPPIGAQGLNMSLADLRALLDLAQARPDGLGDAEMLERYHRDRIGDIRMRVAGIAVLNCASIAGARPLRDVRAAGVSALYALAPVRQMLMRMGMAAA